MTVTTYPAHLARRYTNHQGVVGDVASDDGTGGDERVSPNIHSTDHRRVGADRAAATQQGLLVERVTIDFRARIGDVRENAGGPQKDEVLDDRSLVNRDVVLDFDRVAENYVVGDVAVLTEHAISSNL